MITPVLESQCGKFTRHIYFRKAAVHFEVNIKSAQCVNDVKVKSCDCFANASISISLVLFEYGQSTFSQKLNKNFVFPLGGGLQWKLPSLVDEARIMKKNVRIDMNITIFNLAKCMSMQMVSYQRLHFSCSSLCCWLGNAQPSFRFQAYVEKMGGLLIDELMQMIVVCHNIVFFQRRSINSPVLSWNNNYYYIYDNGFTTRTLQR